MSTIQEKAREVLLGAIEVLRERGWYQGDFAGPDGSVCVVGACYQHLFGQPHPPARFSGDDAAVLVFAINVLALLKEPNIAVFNDDPSTSYEDVVLILKRAAELAEEIEVVGEH